MSHTVTITRLPDADHDDYEYEFGGAHGHDCEVYVECKRKACQAMNPEYEPFDERFRHGKQHFHRDGYWVAESDICALRYVFEYSGPDEAFDGLTLGVYPVRVEWEDTRWIEVQNQTPVEVGQ